MDKQTLKAKIEKTFHKLVVNQIKEQIIDFTVLYVRRNNMDVDRESMTKILEVIRVAVDDAFYKSIDSTMNTIDGDLQTFMDEANPLAPTKSAGRKKKTA